MTDDEQIAEWLKQHKGPTVCSPAYAAPTQAALDRKAEAPLPPPHRWYGNQHRRSLKQMRERYRHLR